MNHPRPHPEHAPARYSLVIFVYPTEASFPSDATPDRREVPLNAVVAGAATE